MCKVNEKNNIVEILEKNGNNANKFNANNRRWFKAPTPRGLLVKVM